MRRGVSLIELLVVMVLTFILGAGIFALYRSIVGSAAEESSIMKNQAQLNFVVDNLARLLSSAGFGIERNKLDYGNGNVIDLQNNSLTILTRASTQNANAGCWGIIDENGAFQLQTAPADPLPVSFTTGRNCPSNPGQYSVRISIEDKSPNCSRNCLAFLNIPTNTVSLSLSNQNLQPLCLQGTQRLMLDMNGSSGDIVSCVGHLRFRYLRGQNGVVVAQDQPPPYNELVGVRLCMMVQLSESAPVRSANTEPTYTERCGGGSLTQLNPALQNTWMNRKWSTVELDIFMPNLARP